MSAVPTEDWWTDWQLAIVEDRSCLWREQAFQPSDALAFPMEGGGTTVRRKKEDEVVPSKASVVVGGWDHAHCALCWERISACAGDQASGYTDGKDQWLCATCHNKYIVPRWPKA